MKKRLILATVVSLAFLLSSPASADIIYSGAME